MKKHWRLSLAMAISIALALTACSDSDNKDKQGDNAMVSEAPENSKQSEEEGQTQDQEQAEEAPAADEGADADQEAPADNEAVDEEDTVTAADLKANLEIGDSQESVIELLGEADQEVTVEIDGSTAWRYDRGAKDGYAFDSVTDVPDMEALDNGSLASQIFVHFDGAGKVSGYTAYQNNESGKLQVHYYFANGEYKSETIE